MPFQKVEFEFPDDKEDKGEDIEIESTDAEEVKKPAKPEPDDEYEIEVVDDVPKADRNRKPSEPPPEVTDEELEDYSEKVRNRIKHFSKGYHDERRAKEQALRDRQELERLATQLVEENKNLKGTVDKNQEVLIGQAKKALETQINSAKRQYKSAYESGDSDKVLDAQEKLTNAKIKADKLANYKPKPLQQAEDEVQIPQEAAQQAVDPRAQEWAEENPWFNSDPEMTGYARGLHGRLVNEGVDPSSDEYYETINSRMRKLFPEQFDEVEVDEVEVETKSKRRSNVVAPATRSTSSKKVTLKRTQVALAKKLGIPLEEYARHEAALKMRKD
tara:strand:- start:447 stop:1439 length:993 start_codon:yes stop_codon:yes gene_type:complete